MNLSDEDARHEMIDAVVRVFHAGPPTSESARREALREQYSTTTGHRPATQLLDYGMSLLRRPRSRVVLAALRSALRSPLSKDTNPDRFNWEGSPAGSVDLSRSDSRDDDQRVILRVPVDIDSTIATMIEADYTDLDDDGDGDAPDFTAWMHLPDQTPAEQTTLCVGEHTLGITTDPELRRVRLAAHEHTAAATGQVYVELELAGGATRTVHLHIDKRLVR